MSKLAVGVKQFGRMVIGRVLEQVESLRSRTEDESLTLWTSSDEKFTINSVIDPDLCKSILYIRGEITDKDNEEFYHLFGTEEEAAQCVQHIREGVAAINAEGGRETAAAGIELERIE